MLSDTEGVIGSEFENSLLREPRRSTTASPPSLPSPSLAMNDGIGRYATQVEYPRWVDYSKWHDSLQVDIPWVDILWLDEISLVDEQQLKRESHVTNGSVASSRPTHHIMATPKEKPRLLKPMVD